MKKIIAFLLGIITMVCIAQLPVGYVTKPIYTDASGNVLTNSGVNYTFSNQFRIIESPTNAFHAARYLDVTNAIVLTSGDVFKASNNVFSAGTTQNFDTAFVSNFIAQSTFQVGTSDILGVSTPPYFKLLNKFYIDTNRTVLAYKDINATNVFERGFLIQGPFCTISAAPYTNLVDSVDPRIFELSSQNCTNQNELRMEFNFNSGGSAISSYTNGTFAIFPTGAGGQTSYSFTTNGIRGNNLGGTPYITNFSSAYFDTLLWAKSAKITNSFQLGDTGLVYPVSGQPFFHNTGDRNTYLGQNSGNITTTSTDNTGFGANSLASQTSGSLNSSFGSYSMMLNNGTGNSSFGYGSLYVNINDNNSSFGRQSLNQNTSGNQNCSFGSQSMLNDKISSLVSSFGNGSMLNHISGNESSSFGYLGLYNSTNSTIDTAIGGEALYSIVSGSTENVGAGWQSLSLLVAGVENTAIGTRAMRSLTNGNYNVGLGYFTGGSLEDGLGNTYVGWSAGPQGAIGTLTNSSAIGYASQVKGNNTMVLGGMGSNKVGVVIGGTNQLLGTESLRVEGQIVTDGNYGLTCSITNVGIGVTNVEVFANGLLTNRFTIP